MSSVAFDFTERVVVVTGAAGGLGSVCASALGLAGAKVVITDVSHERLDEVADKLAQRGIEVHAVPADLADAAAAYAVVATASKIGTIQHLVACAGVMQTRPLLDLSPQDWQRMLSINLNGAFYVLQAAAGAMRDGGSIVMLASVAARSGRPDAAHYAASKAAVVSLVKSAAMALAPNVRVNAICPGLFLTPMWDDIIAARDRLFGEQEGELYLDRVRRMTPLGRDGQPAELANAVLFLLSDAASFITGQALNVDGGLEMD